MENIVKLVMERTGLPEQQAKTAVETVVGFLKQKLPDPVAARIDTVLESEATVDQIEDIIDKGSGALGGLLKKR